MEFFKGVNVDWMGKAKYFVTLSLVLLAVGWASILKNGGLRYGIDFRGGTLVYVRFAGTPPIDQIRKGLQSAGLANSTIQSISDIGNSGIAARRGDRPRATRARATSRSTPARTQFSTFCTRPSGLTPPANRILIPSPHRRWRTTSPRRIRWPWARMPAIVTKIWRRSSPMRAIRITAGSSRASTNSKTSPA